jgi:hypothetical protein
MEAIVVTILVEAIRSPELSWPEVSEQDRVAHAEARRVLYAQVED